MFRTPLSVGKSVYSFSPKDHHYLFSDKVSSNRSSPEYLSVHSPLGRSAAMSHYDKPVPGYVTEYMASFKKPPEDAYCNTPIKLLKSDIHYEEESELSNIDDNESHSSILTPHEQLQLETKLHEALRILEKRQIQHEENNIECHGGTKKSRRKWQEKKHKKIINGNNVKNMHQNVNKGTENLKIDTSI